MSRRLACPLIIVAIGLASMISTLPVAGAIGARKGQVSRSGGTTCGSLGASSPLEFFDGLTSTPSSTTFQAGYSPKQVKGAYNLTGPYTGAGTTIAVVVPCDDPNAASDFDVFSQQFGLPTIAGGCNCFSKVNQNGGAQYPPQDSKADHEISIDIEWAHAIAPGANILLVEANSAALSDMLTAEDYATSHAQIVSNSWAMAEFSGETADDSHFNKPVAIVFAAANSGAHAKYPSSSPYVLSVGGTTLKINGRTSGGGCISSGCTYGGETVWNNRVDAGGGGPSKYEKEPAYQQGYCGTTTNVNNCGGMRGTPDLAFNAGSGVAVYDSIPFVNGAGQTCQYWCQGAGTSTATPTAAGIIALADQAHGTIFTTNNLTTRFVYQSDASATNYGADYHDITVGSNNLNTSCCMAGTGYDLASGLGSPNGLAWIQAA